MEQELEHLTKEGVIEPIQLADWVAPIVPVMKGDGKSIRIWGDFKVTVIMEFFARVGRLANMMGFRPIICVCYVHIFRTCYYILVYSCCSHCSPKLKLGA